MAFSLSLSLCSKGADTSAVDDRGRIPKRLASRKEISNLLAAKEMESKVGIVRAVVFRFAAGLTCAERLAIFSAVRGLTQRVKSIVGCVINE